MFATSDPVAVPFVYPHDESQSGMASRAAGRSKGELRVGTPRLSPARAKYVETSKGAIAAFTHKHTSSTEIAPEHREIVRSPQVRSAPASERRCVVAATQCTIVNEGVVMQHTYHGHAVVAQRQDGVHTAASIRDNEEVEWGRSGRNIGSTDVR